MIRFTTLLISVLSVFAIGTSAHAQSKAYVGGVVGLSVPDADDTSSRPMYGILGGARLDGEFGVGAFYFSSKNDETIAGRPGKFDYDLYGVEGSYHFEGLSENAYMAARIGLAKVKAGTTATGYKTYTPLAWGFAFGYDYPVTETFTLGGEAGFMSVQGAKKSGGNLDGFLALQFLAAAKFWF